MMRWSLPASSVYLEPEIGTGNHQYVSIDWRIDDGGLFRTGRNA